jgi:hypothetical protein
MSLHNGVFSRTELAASFFRLYSYTDKLRMALQDDNAHPHPGRTASSFRRYFSMDKNRNFTTTLQYTLHYEKTAYSFK